MDPVRIMGSQGTTPFSGGTPPRTRGEAFTAGSWSHPDMRRWVPSTGSADADLNPELDLIRRRARDLTRNHGVAEGSVQTLVDNVVGSGLRLKSRPNWRALKWTPDQAEEWSNQVEALWCAWAESLWCDAGGSLTFHGLTVQAFRSSFTNGDAIALPLWLDRAGAPTSTCLQMIEADRLANPNGQPDRRDLRGGVRIDEYGAPLGYWIRKSHPGDVMRIAGEFYSDSLFIPAFTEWGRRRVIHLHDKERVGQSRGKPSLTSVLRQFKVLGDFTNAELKAAVVNSMVAMVTESNISQEGLVELLAGNPDALSKYQDGLAQRNRSAIDYQAGQIIPLMLGEKLNSFTPGRPSESFEPFTLSVLRHIAAGLNIPYELLLKDFSKTNYSSARAALLEAWRYFRGRRRWLTTYWLQPVFELWLEELVMTGQVEAPNFYRLRAYYGRAKWIGDGRGWVDPLKEVQAAECRMRNGITTLEDECAEQGVDWEEQLEQRAREQARAEKLDVSLPWLTGTPTHPDQYDTQDPDAPAGTDGNKSEKPKQAAAGSRPRSVNVSSQIVIPESVGGTFTHEMKGVEQLAAHVGTTVERLGAIVEGLNGQVARIAEFTGEVVRSGERVSELAEEVGRVGARSEQLASDVQVGMRAVDGAVRDLSTEIQRSANKVAVYDANGNMIGSRPARPGELEPEQ
jgi:lambda family phage portal protein